MKPILATVLFALACHACAEGRALPVPVGDSFDVERMPFGSGTPSPSVTSGSESARHVADGLYHVPNYLPGYPTAAVIWPRELPLECEAGSGGKPSCSGYEVIPAVGRGEYIFVRPMLKEPPKPEVKIEQPPPPPPAPVPVVRKKPLG